MARAPTDVAFTPAVKAVQTSRGSRQSYARMDAAGFAAEVTAELTGFLAEVDTAFLATANAGNQPYVQHRGGAPGFLRVLDDHTIGFADLVGNRQYVTTGNLAENPKVALIAIDYATKRRVKIWGTARVVGIADPAVAGIDWGAPGRIEQVILIDVSAWDVNCPQHIPQKVDVAAVEPVVRGLRDRITALEAEAASLRAALARATAGSGTATRG